MHRPDLDVVARFVVSVAVVLGGAAIGLGFWQAHRADIHAAATAREQTAITALLRRDHLDAAAEVAEDHELQGAVAYLEQALHAVCAQTHTSCPPLPKGVP